MTKQFAVLAGGVVALIFSILIVILIVKLFLGNSSGPTSYKPADDQFKFFGAIARDSQSGNLGYAARAKSKEQAQQSSVGSCGAGCAVILWFQNGCGAFAQAGSAWGAGLGASMDEARTKALGVCKSYSQQEKCNVRLLVCSNGTVKKE